MYGIDSEKTEIYKDITENTKPDEKNKHEKKGIGVRWTKLDVRKTASVFRLSKIILFVLLLLSETVILVESRILSKGIENVWFVVTICSLATLSVSETVKLLFLKRFKQKIWCYAVDFIAAFLLTASTNGVFLSALYMIVLTEYYMSSIRFLPSFLGYIVCLTAYIATSWLSGALTMERVSVITALSQSVNALMILSVHFFVVLFGVKYYRQFVKLSDTLEELDKNRAELQKAYDELQEVTLLEERQRIAKDIHDTAGHSITTVIMQTEAAKLILPDKPDEAKIKIVAANLQAKHALEELRESVHLLSGRKGGETLKDALLSVIHESTDGTNIVIRSDIDELCVSDAKFRFIKNTLKEGISNGLRHGNATAFWFECKADGKKIRFLLSDNGTGTSELKKGFGLSAMEERAERFGGKVSFSSEPDEGFEITLDLPFDGE